jgi:lipid-A-disaccharide synthase-like uncharacterized protein
MIAITWIGQEHRLWMLDWSWLDLVGLSGQLIFSYRFLSQWIASEKRGESIIPVSFWYWSIAGSLILTVYWVFKRSPIGIIANLPNTLIYWRNLRLVRKRKLAPTAATATQTPKEDAS